MKKNFVKSYFENKTGESLKKTITPNWNSTSSHIKLLNIDENINSIAEIGCGIGRILKDLNVRIPICVGFDASQSMIDEGEKYCKETNINLIKCSGDGLIPYESDFFDYTFSFITFQHIPNTDAVIMYITEMYRILNSKGKIKIQLLKNDEFPEKELWTYHDPIIIKSNMDKIGFYNINQLDFGRWIFITAEKYDSK
jgi:ubiquinone/menaquinone biosynthesis C-methylase UbiE